MPALKSAFYYSVFAIILLVSASLVVPKNTFIKTSGSIFKRADKEELAVKWMSMEQAQDSMRVKPKKIFVKIYADWCHICKMMDRKTLSKARIIKMLDKDYYAVRLNAEQTANIKFNDSTYTYNPTLGKGIHNLAYHLGKEAGTVSYPTLVILNDKLEVTYRYPGYMSVINLEEVLDLYK